MARHVARAEEIALDGKTFVWDLYDDAGDLIGWTLDVPPRSMTVRDAFSYSTGHVVPVQYTALTTYTTLK